MKFNVNHGVVKMLEILERSPQVRRLATGAVWGAYLVLILHALPALINALRWW